MKAIPSRADPSKWGCAECDYGHDSGKSRNGVYKHHKKMHESVSSENTPKNELKNKSRSTPKISEENLTESVSTDYVQNEYENSGNDWGSIEWEETEEGTPKPRTIPEPLSDMAKGKVSAISSAAQGQVIRFCFMSLDRMLTHYGRGVMNSPDWEVERAPSDYDTLEASTLGLMAHYGVVVPVSPLMVWTATVGSAYAPPLMHIRKNADPNRKGRFSGMLRRLIPRRRKKKKVEVVEDGQNPNA